MAHVLIAGCGYVGTALGEQLAREGHLVWGLRRRAQELPAGLRPLPVDLGDEPGLRNAVPETTELVVYAAGPDGRTEDAYTAAYVDGPRKLLSALAAVGAPVRRVVMTTSTAVYGEQQGEWVDEETPPHPATATGRCVLEGEQEARKGPFGATVARLAGIYGPGRAGLVQRIREGRARLPREPRYTNRIHRDDCAGVLRHLLLMDDPDPVYIGADCEPSELGEVMCWLADRLGVPHPPRQQPGEETGSRARAHKRCANGRLRNAGYRFRHPTFRDGYAQVLAELERSDDSRANS